MQQYDQRRLRLFAVVLFLGIMAANLGRYLIFDGLYLWDARLRWQECAYVLHGLNPFDVMHSRVPSIESIGWLDASLGGTVPWAYVLGNVINPGFLPYSAMCVYIAAGVCPQHVGQCGAVWQPERHCVLLCYPFHVRAGGQ